MGALRVVPGLVRVWTVHPAAHLADTLRKTGVEERANACLVADGDTPSRRPECATISIPSDLLFVPLDTGLTSAQRPLLGQLVLGCSPLSVCGQRGAGGIENAGHPFCAHLAKASRWFPHRPELQTCQARPRGLRRCSVGL